jgi:hypothetical protein
MHTSMKTYSTQCGHVGMYQTENKRRQNSGIKMEAIRFNTHDKYKSLSRLKSKANEESLDYTHATYKC